MGRSRQILVLGVSLAVALFTVVAFGGALASPVGQFTNCSDLTESAIQSVINGGGSSPVEIQYTGATQCTVPLTSQLSIGASQTVSIDGGSAGIAFDASNDADANLIVVGSSATLSLNNVQMTLQGGKTGYIGINAITRSNVTINLTNSTVKALGFGFGVVASFSHNSSIKVANSTFTTTVTGAAGIYAPDAYNDTIEVSNSSFTSTGGGYGIFAQTDAGSPGAGGTSITATNSSFSTDSGGSSIIVWNMNGAKVTATNSTFSVNGFGYGINAGRAPSSTIDVANSTFSVTYQNGSSGGGKGIYAQGASGTISVTSSTFSLDQLAIGIDASNPGDGGITTTMSDSVLSGKRGSTNCGGTITDGGYNISASPDGSDGSCGFSSANHSQTITNSVLNLANGGALGNYGGPTQTIALGPNSPAIDAIPSGSCPTIIDAITGDPITTDQRGINRPQGSGCDIGAYEAPAVSLSTTPGSPDTTTGWYNASTLGGTGKTLGISAGFSGLATGQQPTCTGATFTGLPTTAVTGLNQAASGSASLGDGTYSISCGVSQGTTTLGVSTDGQTEPLNIKIDTTAPTASITSPANNAVIPIGSSTTATFTCADGTGSGVPAANCVGTLDTDPTTFTSGRTLDTSASAAGQHTLSVTATDAAGNSSSSVSVTYDVEKVTPSISWSPAPTTITYGDKLGAGQFNATATDPNTQDTVSGTFSYTYQSGGQSVTVTQDTVLPAGSYQITANFTPSDGNSYKAASSSPVTFTVNQATLTITAPNPTFSYGTTVSATDIAPSFASFVNGENASVLGDGFGCVLTDSHDNVVTLPSTPAAGSYTITCSGAVDPNYAISYVPGTVTITQVAATITWNPSPATITYGDALTATAQLNASGSVDGTISYSYSGTTKAGTAVTDQPATSGAILPAGSYILTATLTPSNGNYTGASNQVALTVSPASLTVTVDDKSRSYGATNPTFTGTISGVVNNDAISVSYSTVATASSNVGPYAITATIDASAAVLSNYTVSNTPGTLTITQAPLTITAPSPTMAYGDKTLPDIAAVTYDHFVNGQNSSVLLGTLNCDLTTTSGAPRALASSLIPGSYIITCSGQSSTNYSISYVTGMLTVTPGTPVISWTPASTTLTYGNKLGTGRLNAAAADPATTLGVAGSFTYTYQSGGQSITVTTGSVLPAGSYQITATFTPADPTIYTGASSEPVTFTVNQATLTITAPTLSISYGASVSTSDITPSFNAFVNGEGAGVLGGGFGCVLTDSHSDTILLPAQLAAGSYTITCAGAVDPNYSISYQPGSVSVAADATAITEAPNQQIVYGTTSVAFGTSVVIKGSTTAVTEGSISFKVMQGTDTLCSTAAAPVDSQGMVSNVACVFSTAPDAGSYTVVVSYHDNQGNYADSSSNGSLTVVARDSTLKVTSNPVVVTGSASVQLTASVSAGDLTVNQGSVTFTLKDAKGNAIGSATSGDVASGKVSVNFAIPTGTPLGVYTVSASYHDASGDFGDSQADGTVTITYGATIANDPIVVNHNYYALIVLKLVDAAGHNLSSRTLKVTAQNLAPQGQDWNGKNGNFVYPFQFGNGGYQLTLNTRSLSIGTYVLSYRVAGDPAMHTVTIQIK